MQMKVKDLKEVLKDMSDDALIFVGEEVGNMNKVTDYEHPTGEKSSWEFINLVYRNRKG